MRVAFVTGAVGDIGRAICAELLEREMAVAGVDRNQEGLHAAARELAAGSRFLPIQGDVTKMESVRAAARQVAEVFGDVSVLVNNAGGITRPSLLTTEEEHWIRDIELNLNGPWRCIHALQQQLIRKRPSVIVNIASVNGLGVFGHPGYSVAKAGLIHLTRFCAVELAKHGVRSVALCPGSVKTQAWEERKRAQPRILEEAASWYPSRDTCTPRDVAHLVASVIDERALPMNGAVITLDGGLAAGSDRLASVFAGEPI
jgi:NAD(P)-dependent dehydrogenase (short-subunit alcohol dehydrogenase family)